MPVALPAGTWPVAVNDGSLAKGAAEIVSGESVQATGAIEADENRTACLDRTHLLWIRGPLESGTYAVRPSGNAPATADVRVEESADGLVLRRADRLIRFDAWNGGCITAADVGPPSRWLRHRMIPADQRRRRDIDAYPLGQRGKAKG